jgi:glutaminyl-peptide cyclotransferase
MAKSLKFLAIFVLISACAPQKSREIWSDFDAERAFSHVERVVAFGPRPSGSDALKKSGEYIAEQLKSAGLSVEFQDFTAPTPRGAVQFRNVVGKTSQKKSGKIIVIGAHYDTKWMPEIEFVGANDGGSGVGVLLEMARVASRVPNLQFVFFDGEECFIEYGPEDGLWGSRFFVAAAKNSGELARFCALFLLDMVGDADLNVGFPRRSSPELMQAMFDAARALGFRDYFRFHNIEMMDDHVPFLEAGVPSINVIDFDFPHWHTAFDTLDKVSAQSLNVVGKTVLKTIVNLPR